jgi:hypothetical protein
MSHSPASYSDMPQGKSKFEADLKRNLPDLTTNFYIDKGPTQQIVALKWLIFK